MPEGYGGDRPAGARSGSLLVSPVPRLRMAADVLAERARAMGHLGRGDWQRGLAILRTIVEASRDPEDRLLLGRMAYVAAEWAEAGRQLETAYGAFQAAG